MAKCQYPIVNSGYPFWESGSDNIYEMLKYLGPGLMADVGAAMGIMTEKILLATPDSRVMAFEPYPPNCALFNKKFREDARVNLVEKAVADKTSGEVIFCIPHAVRGDEKGWESFTGYSSVGYISNDPSQGESIAVPVTTVSKEIHEHVLFMKIDVQGGESAVLRGCHSIIRDHGIDVMLIEFTGQKDVLHFLASRDYVLFDTRYMLIPHSSNPPTEGWLINGSANLSTGVKALFGWPLNRPVEIMAYCEMIRTIRMEIGYIQTDIVAVHESFMGEFLSALGRCELTTRTPSY